MVTKKSTQLLTRIAISLIVLIIVSTASYNLYQSYQKRIWNYEGNFAMLNISDISVTVFVPDREAIYTFMLPKHAYIEVPGGYGLYEVEDVVELSFVEENDGSLLSRAITTGIGIPVTITSDRITLWDRIQMWIAQQNYQGKRETFNLDDEPIFGAETRPDNSQISVVDPDKLASLTAELLWEKSIISEQLAVGVFNASGTPALASSISHMLETMGVHVVDYANWEDEKVPGICLFRVLDSAYSSVTLARLESVLRCDIERLQDTEGRFDIQLILNELPL